MTYEVNVSAEFENGFGRARLQAYKRSDTGRAQHNEFTSAGSRTKHTAMNIRLQKIWTTPASRQ